MVDVKSGSSLPLVGVAAGVLAAAGFSLKAVLAKLVYRHGVDPTTLLALRMAFAVPIYAGLALHSSHGRAPLGRATLARVAGVGIVGYFVASYFDFLGLHHITAGLERLVLYLYPTFVLVFGVLWFRKRVRAREVLGLLAAYAGLGIALSHDVALGRDTHELVLGTGFVFLSALTYAAYVVGSGELAPSIGSVRFTSVAMLAAAVPMLIVFVVRGGLSTLASIPIEVVGLAAIMAVFATVVPSLMMTVSIRRLGSTRAAILGSVGPVLTIGLESSLLDEPISSRTIFGTVLVVSGVLGASLVPEPARVVRDEAS